MDTLAILRRSMAYSRIMDTKGEKMITQDFSPQAKLSQHLKDVRLMIAASSIPLPLSETHRQLLEKAESLGFGDADNSAVIEAILPRSGTCQVPEQDAGLGKSLSVDSQP
ncbi:MAG: NAD(P)-dependent oxidoreductase [Verrucomicrobiaceae bacterium]|nr:NAD(P)-dependent oxidoreductase [Verrucomicrobiaceae bacterium]